MSWYGGDIYGICELFDLHTEDVWGVLLVDAQNVFNSVNSMAALRNATIHKPRCSRFLFNH